jgi:hypothetical protein
MSFILTSKKVRGFFMKKMGYVKTTIYLSPEKLWALKVLREKVAAQRKEFVSVSDLIRDGIEAIIEEINAEYKIDLAQNPECPKDWIDEKRQVE